MSTLSTAAIVVTAWVVLACPSPTTPADAAPVPTHPAVATPSDVPVCPKGTTLQGAKPPAGDALFCARTESDGRTVRHGPEVGYHANGRVYWRQTNRDGVAEGEQLMYHDNGQLESRGQMKAGLQDGPWTGWYPTGERQTVFRYHAGKRDGTGQTFYPSGQLQEVSNYRRGTLHGVQQALCRDGSEWRFDRYDKGVVVESRHLPANAIPCEPGSAPQKTPALPSPRPPVLPTP